MRRKEMIVGIGMDIIEVERIRKLAEKNPRFLQRVFTPEEILYCLNKKNKHQHFAARFAAKEAFFKALGRRIGWKEVGLVNLPSGKPSLEITAKYPFPFQGAHVSVSHIKDYAAAVVVLEQSEK